MDLLTRVLDQNRYDKLYQVASVDGKPLVHVDTEFKWIKPFFKNLSSIPFYFNYDDKPATFKTLTYDANHLVRLDHFDEYVKLDKLSPELQTMIKKELILKRLIND